MKRILTIDYETRSPVDIKMCGAYAYAASPYTEPMMLAVKENDEEARMWIAPKFRDLFPTEISDEELQELITSSDKIVAHNAFFERCITKFHMPFCLPLEKTCCTMAQSLMCGLPRDLDSVAKLVSGGGFLKDKEGHNLMLKMSKPRAFVKSECESLYSKLVDLGFIDSKEDWKQVKVLQKKILDNLSVGEKMPEGLSLKDFVLYYESKNDFIRLVEYARQDVRVEYMVFMKLPKLSESEHKVWQLDQVINDRGVKVDVKNAKGILRTIDNYVEDLQKEALDLTDNTVTSMKSTSSIKYWLETKGLSVSSIDKENVKFLLTLELDPVVRKFLEMRQILGRSSIAKYKTILAQSFVDQRCHGLFIYHGAGTGRWAGAGVQPQNLPRPAGIKNACGILSYEDDLYADEYDAEMLSSGDIEAVKMFWKDPMTLSADLIRTMFMASEGKEFVCADFSAVEARGIAWLAEQESQLEAFIKGRDIYKVAASGIFKIRYEDVDGGGKGDQRQIGKTATLACGFGGGWGAMLRFGADKLGLTEEEGEQIVKAWREANNKIVEWWYALTKASVCAMQYPGERFKAGKYISFKKEGKFLTMRLPSGRNLYYPSAKVEEVEMPWSTESKPVFKKVVTAMTQNVAKQWIRQPLSHVKLSENATQATCRDLLVNAMMNVEKAGYKVVMHIHDEIVCEIEKGKGNLKEFESLMTKTPSWAEGLPLKAEGWIGNRYKK